MCSCILVCKTEKCPHHNQFSDYVPSPIDWTKPIQVVGITGRVPDGCKASLLGEANTKHEVKYAVATCFADGSGNILVCSRDGTVLSGAYGWEHRVENAPRPKKKIKLHTVLSLNGTIMQVTEERFNGRPAFYRGVKILKTEEFEVEV
jgi:hypothetical protein